MHYFIDGYNLLFKIAPAKQSLEKKRLHLISELNDIVSSLQLKATIVFDGSMPQPAYATRQHFAELEIVYTPKKQSADDYIIAEIERSKRPAQIVVVTSDRSLSAQCRAHGARTQSIQDFIAELRKKKRKKKIRTTNANPKAFAESEANLARYLLIFEKRLLED